MDPEHRPAERFRAVIRYPSGSTRDRPVGAPAARTQPIASPHPGRASASAMPCNPFSRAQRVSPHAPGAPCVANKKQMPRKTKTDRVGYVQELRAGAADKDWRWRRAELTGKAGAALLFLGHGPDAAPIGGRRGYAVMAAALDIHPARLVVGAQFQRRREALDRPLPIAGAVGRETAGEAVHRLLERRPRLQIPQSLVD